MTVSNINQDDYTYICNNYDWFQKTFPEPVRDAYKEFFSTGLRVNLIGISKNINLLMNNESYFVTKIMVDKFRDLYFRASDKAVNAILENALGRSPRAFNLNRLTDIEAKTITSFNDFLFHKISPLLSPTGPTVKRLNLDVIHLTFLVSNEETRETGKFILTLPEEMLSPQAIVSSGEKFNVTDFANCTIEAKIKIGQTKFSVFDLKALEEEDIVIFEKSNISKFTLIFNDYVKEFNINPNLGLVLPIDNEEGDKMGADNIWDSIEVELDAQFDSVKITLGDLKKIEEGQVVDLMPIYDNKITLSVEDKKIATGELVIVNDKYGVKIDKVLAKPAPTQANQESFDNYSEDDEDFSPLGAQEETFDNSAANVAGDEEEEFDYSDFELEDEDI